MSRNVEKSNELFEKIREKEREIAQVCFTNNYTSFVNKAKKIAVLATELAELGSKLDDCKS